MASGKRVEQKILTGISSKFQGSDNEPLEVGHKHPELKQEQNYDTLKIF